MSEEIDPQATVGRLLAAAGLSPHDAELVALAANYLDNRARIDALYAIPEARYVAPALIFDASPTFTEWWRTAPQSEEFE